MNKVKFIGLFYLNIAVLELRVEKFTWKSDSQNTNKMSWNPSWKVKAMVHLNWDFY